MLNDRDQYLHQFAADALSTVLQFLRDDHKGALREFSVMRSAAGDWVAVRFMLDSRPGVEFSFQHPAWAVGVEPQMSARSAVGVLWSSLLERTAFKRGAESVDGTVNLNAAPTPPPRRVP